MICIDCKEAGDALQDGKPEEAAIFHNLCRGGTWCDCKHSLQLAMPELWYQTREAIDMVGRRDTAIYQPWGEI